MDGCKTPKHLFDENSSFEPFKRHSKHLRILNRLVAWVEGRGLRYEADPRHVEQMVRDVGVFEGRVSKVPGAKAVRHKESEEDKTEDIARRKRDGTLGKEGNPNAGGECHAKAGYALQSCSGALKLHRS